MFSVVLRTRTVRLLISYRLLGHTFAFGGSRLSSILESRGKAGGQDTAHDDRVRNRELFNYGCSFDAS